MTKVRIYDPELGVWAGINTDHIASWYIETRSTPAINIRVRCTDGKEYVFLWNKGAQELSEFLLSEFAPLSVTQEKR